MNNVTPPYFEDFTIGQTFSEPAVTLTSGHAVLHQALFGDRMRLPLDHHLSNKVTGNKHALVHPNLVANLVIGQTTTPSQRVKGNLFYRGLTFEAPVFLGDTLNTQTKIIALRSNKPKPNRDATGMVLLEIEAHNNKSERVMHFWRCPMIACREAKPPTDRNDDFDNLTTSASMDNIVGVCPTNWQLSEFSQQLLPMFSDLVEGQEIAIEARDTITCAPELVRSTLNMAMTHTDAGSSYLNERLVYGGHVISMAFAQATRALPSMVTILGWFQCDHLAPVTEGDRIQTKVLIEHLHPLETGGVAKIRVRSTSESNGTTKPVLDWQVATLLA